MLLFAGGCHGILKEKDKTLVEQLRSFSHLGFLKGLWDTIKIW